jgi:hypothetical protein
VDPLQPWLPVVVKRLEAGSKQGGTAGTVDLASVREAGFFVVLEGVSRETGSAQWCAQLNK